jgi:NAD(P)-dependent dehydrogenase (short-subunit alcohol dehydrogenase family)
MSQRAGPSRHAATSCRPDLQAAPPYSITATRQTWPGTAAACAFLVSAEAGYITGPVIGVNGGRNT